MTSMIAGLLAVAACVAVAQEPFQRDKVRLTRGRHEYVPLESPTFVTPGQATYLSSGELVLGLSVAGEHRAYPLRLMMWHHIANDSVAGTPLTVAF
jgi:hypothetical protein